MIGLEEVNAFLRRPDLFSAIKDLSNPNSPFRGIQIPDNNPEITAGFLEKDPPLQLSYRHVLNSYISPAAIRRWEPLVRDFTNACVNDVVESGRLDFVDDIANIVPAVLTMAILGLPLADWVIYCEPTHAMVYTPPDSPDLLRVQQASMAMVMRLGECVAEARLNPRPGIIKALIEAEVDRQPLSDEGIIGTTFLVIDGGFDTTTSLTSWQARLDQGAAADAAAES